ncbi:MAG: ATP-binding protein [Chloroflexota bacterium]
MNRSFSIWARSVLAALFRTDAPLAAPSPSAVQSIVEQAAAVGVESTARTETAAVAPAASRRELEAALARIFSTAADAIITVDADQRIMMFNHAAEELFGCAASEALGASLTRFVRLSLVSPDPGQAARQAETGVAGWRLGEVTPLQAIRADEQSIPVEVTVTPVTVRGEHLYTAVIRDATKRVQMEAEYRETHRRLEQALADVQRTQEIMLRQERLKALGQLASGIAHDFNNALSMIVGFTELLLAEGDTAEDVVNRRTHLQLIHSAAQDAAHVVGRLREFSRPSIASETMPPVQVNDLVAQAISLSQPRWRSQAQASGQTIRVTAELAQVPPIGGRASDLREALANLIINAVDAMPSGGTLTLRTRLDEDMVLVEVQDTGTGMAPDVRDRIFDPFFTTKGDQGTGLGLPMVQGIVQQHHGEIQVTSELGQGTTFTMRFRPLVAEQEAPVILPPAARPRIRGLHVLLAEDEPSLRQILTSYLRVDGHAIQAVANGLEALEKYRSGPFDLIITDRAMPEMGGDQLAAELEREGSRTPVIMLTGLGDLMNEVGERPPGVDLVVAKPVTLAELRAAVVLVTGESGRAASTA